MFELIYTSYPRGLQSGRSGFTSVAYTEGIPRNHIQLCESLSSYPFIYPLGHPMYDFNPEIYSHYRFKVGGNYGSKVNGEEISILSRIAVSGRDYTGRENKIAHHIILNSDERVECIDGPAWAMIHAALFVEQWNQEPSFLPKRNIVCRDNLPLTALSKKAETEKEHWQTIFGDAGGANLIAQSAQDYPNRPSFILFDQIEHRGISLALISEALELVPAKKRWDITFNTFFVSQNMDSDCLWRCSPLNFTSLHKTFEQTTTLDYIEKYPGSIVIDLCNRSVFGKISSTEVAQRSDSSFAPSTEELPEDAFSAESINSLHSDSPFSARTDKEEPSRLSGLRARALWRLLLLSGVGAVLLFILFSDYTPWSVPPEIAEESHSTTKDRTINTKRTTNKITTNPLSLQNNRKDLHYESIPTTEPPHANGKKMVLNFYGESYQLFKDSTDLKNIECRIIKNDGMEAAVGIEKPIANDTPNWAIVDKGSAQPVGDISIEKISLYDKALYSAIYLDIPEKQNIDLIWVGKLKMIPSMISIGSEPETLEIRFAPEMSDLLPLFLELLSSEDLTGVVELNNTDVIPEESEDNLRAAADILKNSDSESSQVQNLKQGKNIFYPLCSLKNDIKDNLAFIQLKFTNNEFKTIMKMGASENGLVVVKNGGSNAEDSGSALDMLYPFKTDNMFKEFRIDYKDRDRTYPILCLTCKQ